MSEKEKSKAAKNIMQTQKFELLISQDKINNKVEQMGKQISFDYKDEIPILIGVLKGCVIFMADLMRAINIPIEIDFIDATSYSNGSDQDDQIVVDHVSENKYMGRHLIIVEGVVDSGRTVRALINRLNKQEPASIEIVTLLDKPVNRQGEIDIKYKGFDAGDNFVIGFGLDISQKYRNLPFIGRVIED